MKYVFVVRDLGGSSSTGIEVLKFYKFLKSKTSDFLFLAAYSEVSEANVVVLKPTFGWIPIWLQKLILIFLGLDLASYVGERRLIGIVNKGQIKEVKGLTSSSDFYVLNIVHRIQKGYTISSGSSKVHFFDPIPAKPHWGENRYLGNAKRRLTAKFIKNIDKFSTASGAMSAYMTEMYNRTFEVAYSSIESWSFRDKLDDTTPKRKKAYYLGSIYGKRNPGPLLSYFSGQEEWELHIYGMNTMGVTCKNVYFHGFIEDIKSLESPKVLIDLDIDEVDVFIPGKSYTYLGSDVPILLIAGVGSAVREFYGFSESEKETIVQSGGGIVTCMNVEDQISQAMQLCLAIPKEEVLPVRQRLIQVIQERHIGRDY